ncbi:Acetamidase regulatory protein [Fusarium oxysporum f. sp. rapae]|uniref:Acetamidase regulatory protein n=1 Tax=Fusarium oxysporum f. sp. rapae TaxID=485398 RepID=A0A8J5U338_FUSOX|nr:Acetamidase regulatory protein [Fusarium oxysporum f. sp. rapae]
MPTERRDTTAHAPTGNAQSAVSRRRTNGRACITCHQRKRQQPQCLTAPATPRATAALWPEVTIDPVARPSSSTGHYQHDSPSTMQDSAENEETYETRNLADFIGQDLPKVGEISRSERLYFIGTEFSNLNHLVRHRALRRDQKDVLHFGTRRLARKVPSVPEEALKLPPKALADELVTAYFAHVNPGFPIVDGDEFMTSYNGSDVPKLVSLPLLNAIFLVGAHVLSSIREDCRASTYTFFRRAKMLFDCRFEQHRETYLQVALLLTWQCDNLEDIVDNSWHWIGIGARTAFGMGMHRDARSSTLNTIDKRQWVRLWWCLFQFDVMVSASFGRPQAINLEESDTPMLDESHFQGIPHGNPTFAIEHTKLCIIFSKAMRRRVALRATEADRTAATKEADEELAEFITQLPQSLQLSHSNPDTWQATLHLSYHNFLILLHRPPPHQDPSRVSPHSATDHSICGDAVVAINSIFESLRARNMLCNLWLPSVHVLFTSLLHVASELNSPNPLIAAKSSRMFDSLIHTLRDISQYWIYAKSLLRLFEERAMWKKRQRGHVLGSSEDRTFQQSQETTRTGASEFSLRPDPLGVPSIMGDAPSTLQPSSAPVPGPAYGFNFDFGVHQGLSYGEGFSNGLDIAGNGSEAMNLLPVPSVLEFLLAGVDNQYDF